MSYNPNQPYNPAQRRDAGGQYGQAYQSQQQGYAAQKPIYQQESAPQGYHPADPRGQGAATGYTNRPAPAAAAEWDPYNRQGPSANTTTQYANAASANRNPVGAYNPSAAPAQAAPYRGPAQTAPGQQAAYQPAGGQYRSSNPAYDAPYNRSAEPYYAGATESAQNGASSLNSLKQTLAQTISHLAAASASNSTATAAAGGGYASQGYDAYNAGGRAPTQSHDGAYDPARAVAAIPTVRAGQAVPAAATYAPAAGAYSAAPRAAAGIVPGDVRYQAAAQGQPAATRYAPSGIDDRAYAAGGGAPGAYNPPNTGGFYNRRPAQDAAVAQGAPLARAAPVGQNRDYMYDSAAYNPNTAPQQQAYVPSAAPVASRGAYQVAPAFSPVSEEPYPAASYAAPRRSGFDAPPAYTAPAAQQYVPAAAAQVTHRQALPARASKWSARLMDPLDTNDGLLHRSVRTVAFAPAAAAPVRRAAPAAATTAAPAYSARDGDMTRYGPSAGITTSSPAGSKRPRRDRSASPPPAASGRAADSSRARSRSRSADATRVVRSAAEPVRKTSGLPFGARAARPLAYGTSPFSHLVADFHLPAVSISEGAHTVQLRAVDLYTKFPKLYLPNDFVSVRVESDTLLAAMHGDVFTNLVNSVPIVLESNPPTLLPEAEQRGAVSDVLDPPRFSYTHCNVVNNSVVMDHRQMSGQFPSTVRPVKFQVRVLVCCGLKDPEEERIDHNLPQKLRVLCGRRKGTLLLLGCPWSQELDGDGSDVNPISNRSYLVRTVQRALFAQALLKIPVQCQLDGAGQLQYGCEGLVRLCEINYHRPEEEIRGRTYPEQEEVTTIFMYTVQPSLLAQLAAEDLDAQYELLKGRVMGNRVGPLLNRSVADSEREMPSDEPQPADGEAPAAVQQESAEVESGAADLPAAQDAPAAESAAATEDGGVANTASVSDEVNSLLAEVLGQTPVASTGAAPTTAMDTSDVTAAETKSVAATATGSGAKPRDAPTKPNQPTLMLCPMPISNEASADANKKQNALALRLLPLQSVLAYTSDDRSERLFETSVAAELLRSAVSVNYANIVTDFLLAEHEGLRSLCDVRVVDATIKLRAMIAEHKSKVSAAAAIAATPASQNKSTTAGPALQPKADAPAVVVLSSSDDSEVEVVEVGFTVDTKPDAVDASESKAQEGDQAGSAFVGSEADNKNEDVVEQQEQVQNDKAPDAHEPNDAMDQAVVETVGEEQGGVEQAMMPEELARMWRRRFVSAARWFDTTEELCLHYEHLKMILHSSTRNLSRADVEDAVDRVCKGDILRYETFI